MHLLDTDTLSHLHRDHPRVVQRLRELPESEAVGTSVISRIELLRGRFDFMLKAATEAELLRAQELLIHAEAFLAKLLVVPLDRAAAVLFMGLRGRKGLKKIGRADLLIACVTLAKGATLVTRNLRHFRLVPNLRVVNWVD